MSTLEQTRNPDRRREDPLIVHALANGASYKDAAEQADVSRSTVARRMQDPEFRSLVETGRDLVIARARDQLAHAAPAAVDTMVALAANASSESVRLTASRAVVELALSRRPGLAWIDVGEFARFVDLMIEASIDFIPDERRARWLENVTDLSDKSW